jgi:hypothetical protein
MLGGIVIPCSLLSVTFQFIRELAVPFTPEQAPLIRSVLIHKPQSAVLIMIPHHAIADGMALVFLFRDLLQVLSGGQVEALSFSSPAEELLNKLPKREEIVQTEALQARVPQAEPSLYREGNGLAPRVATGKLDGNLTARHESWVRATTDWRRLFARSIGGVLRLCRGDLDAAAAGWTTWPRICGTVHAADGRRCLPGHKARDVANRTTRCGERPKISDPRSSAEGASVFVEMLLSAFGALRSRSQRPDVR